MNKLEFLEKMEEVDALIADGKYDLAVEVCDTLNLSGVKEPRRLQNIAKAYERCRRYKEAETLLQRVRRQVPRSRGVLFRLCSVSVRAGELEDAKDYLSDFIELAPTDPERLILEYRIAEAEERPDANRIEILEKYLSEETDDRWMYTLAELYVRNHREEEAAGVLNAIILWFDSGRYVAKAHAMLVKLGYEEAPAEALEDVPVVPETRTEFPEVEFETPEEVAQQEAEESEEAPAEEEPAEEAAPVEEVAEETETEEPEEEETPAEEAAPAAEIEEAPEEEEETPAEEEPAEAPAEEAGAEEPEAEDEHIVVNITNPRDAGHILRRLDEEDDAVWAQVFDAEDEKEAAEEAPQEEAAEALQEAVSEEVEAAEAYGEPAAEAAEEAREEVLEARAEFSAEDFEDDEYDVDEEDDDAEEAVVELPEEAAPAEEVAEAIPEAAAEETNEVTEAAEEASEAAAETLPEEEAAEEAEEPVKKAAEETAEPIGNFKHEEYGEVIAAEILRRKEERIKFGNIPVEPDMSTSIWHFIAYGETDELALECAREHVKEIAGINKNCPGKLLKISAEKIGKASIVSSLDRFLGNVVIVEHVSLLSDEQLQEFAKVLDHDDMSLLTVFTDTRENIIGVMKRVPALAGSFSAVYEGKKYTADELILAAESYLRGEEARLSDAAEAVVRSYAEDILQEKRGFYRNRVIAYVGKALEAADKGGFLGFGAGRIDKNGILVVDAKHFKNL